MSDEYKRNFYGRSRWQNLRKEVWRERRGLCEECLREGIYTPAAVVHHVKPITPDNITDETVTLSKDNLILLCHKHHNDIHKPIAFRKSKGRYKWDDGGNICPPRQTR